MEQIKFKARLIAPHFTQAPPEEVEKWAKNTIAAAERAYKLSKKAIKTKKDFDQKMGKPIEESLDSFFPETYRTKHGLTKKDIMNKTRDSMKRAGKRYILKREETYKTPKYEESVEFGKKKYAKSWVKKHGPLRGDKKSGIKGLGSLGAMALAGDKELKNFLKKDVDKIEGDLLCITAPVAGSSIRSELSIDPVGGLGTRTPAGLPAIGGSIPSRKSGRNCQPNKMGKFKNVLRNLINRLGAIIIDTGYLPETIRNKNEELNQLVEQYRAPAFVPFTPNGVSYIDFIVVETPNPIKPNEMIKQLGLAMQITRKE